ncbi:hypothetical protein [Leptospira sp. GIMC2001]|uniref:hypothetical protein n=1 Tax=Leptospira sp. GIMC2001 TaxID=1513297 RepID=UPI00234BA7DA|nr:hypothetical protein [Leptospira sp. GIMC2001]WCL47668.1 hypothetical protein O4O04_01485 [Leptospira sp. GIMC2001]
MKASNTKYVLVFIVSIFFIDFLFFRYLLWVLPNTSAWNTNHFYNFIYETKSISNKPKSKPRIFIVGSSIAYYSIDQSLLSEQLRKDIGQEVAVEYFSYAGKSPLYLYLFLEELWKMEPDLVIYPVNFIDFRLHRSFVLEPGKKLEDMREEVLIKDALESIEAPQAKYVFPWETLTYMWKYLSWERRSELFIASFFKFYAYKDFFWDNLSRVYNHKFGRNTSYHGYAGVQIPERVNSLGWTGREFSFMPTDEIQEKGFWIEVVDDILAKGPLEITISNQKTSQKLIIDSPGWKKIILEPELCDRSIVKVHLSNIWKAYESNSFLKDYHRDELGVRLSQTFGLEKPKVEMQYQREERTEDLRYLGMSDTEYREYFFYRLLADLESRPGIRYLYELAEAKKKLANEKFRPIMHFYYLNKISDEFKKRNIPLLIINNPENPISLEWYQNTSWYSDYLDYLNKMQGDTVHFVDLKDALRMQEFSDFHHFTYSGMIKMNSIYAKYIKRISAL